MQAGQREVLLKKIAGVALALAGGVGIGVYFHASNKLYYPVARVAAPGGLTYTAFSVEARGHSACLEANERFVGPLRNDCPTCTVLFERCESNAEAMKLRVAAVSDPVVVSRGFSLAVAGPREVAVTACEAIAQDLAKRGVEGSRCLLTKDAAPRS